MRASTAIACALVVAVTGCRKQDPLFCANHEDPRCGNIDGGVDAAPDAPPGYVTIGGTVDNLAGMGLVLQDNAGDDLAVTADGSFQFQTPIQIGQPYAVTVSSQPTEVTQVCTVDQDGSQSGTAMTNVTSAHVNCVTQAFAVSGTVFGMTLPNSISLLLNGGDSQTLTDNVEFTFQNPKVDSGQTFGVSIQTEPSGNNCTLSPIMGSIAGADFTDVVVNCAVGYYTISGSISGLNGIVMLSDGTNTIQVSGAGATTPFAFPPVMAGTYTISVSGNPSTPIAQTCTVTAPTMVTVTNSDVNSVAVTCTTNTYTIGGTIYELSGTVVLQDNGADDYSTNTNGAFTFATPLASDTTYTVTVKTQPATQTCVLNNYNGTVTNAPVTDVDVVCDSGLKCGGGVCSINGTDNLCCGAGTGGATCDKASDNCMSNTEISCADAADCAVANKANTVCCASVHTGGSSYVTSTTCSATCSAGQAVLCDHNLPNADVCPTGTTCKTYSLLSGYYACQ